MMRAHGSGGDSGPDDFGASRDVPDADDAAMLINLLGLTPHPEGGFYRETYRSAETIPGDVLPERYTGDRAHATAIYYLLTDEGCSRFHRVASDEAFHFYDGDPVEQIHLFPDGRSAVVTIGRDFAAGQQPLVVVPRGVWQGARLSAGGEWALLGTTVAPGFDFDDYEHGDADMLAASWPAQAEMIRSLGG